MLSDFLEDRVPWPNSPDGWVVCPIAVAGYLNAYDEANYVKEDSRGDGLVVWFNSLENLSLLDGDRNAQNDRDLRARERVGRAVDFAQLRIGQAALAGRLKTAARAKEGGAVVPLEAGIWGVDDCWPRLRACALDLERPYAPAGESHWLFFDQADWTADCDAARVSLGLEPIWGATVAEGAVPAMTLASRGGRPTASVQWCNLVGVVAAYAINNDIGDLRPGELYKKLEDYADQIGVPIPALTTAKPSLSRALQWLHAPHAADGQPLKDKDGKDLR